VEPDKPELNPAGTLVSFADGYPYLLASEESLAKLNDKLAEPVPMNRFRPNLVVRGLEAADAEMQWTDFQIGGYAFRSVRGCGRCVVTTIDQATAQKNATEPLRTLATYRKQGNKIMFGQNVTGPASGQLRVGDMVVLS
jgi:uncharacterized protein YcbX